MAVIVNTLRAWLAIVAILIVGAQVTFGEELSKEKIAELDALIGDFHKTTEAFPENDDQVAEYKRKSRNIHEFATETGQAALVMNRLSECLARGDKFTGGDYYILWLSKIGGAAYVDKSVINTLIVKVANRDEIGQLLEIREELGAFVVRFVAASVKYDKSLLNTRGNVDWNAWQEFTEWWKMNRHTLVHDTDSKKLIVR